MLMDINERNYAGNVYTDLIDIEDGILASSKNNRYKVIQGYIGDMNNRKIIVLDTEQEIVVHAEVIPSETVGVAISEDGSKLLFTEMDAPYVKVINTADGTVISDAGSTAINWPPDWVTMTKDGSKVVVFWNSLIKFFDASDFSLLSEIDDSANYPYTPICGGVVTKEDKLVILSDDSGINIYDFETEGLLRSTNYSSDTVTIYDIAVNSEGTEIFCFNDPRNSEGHFTVSVSDGTVLKQNITNDIKDADLNYEYGPDNYKSIYNPYNDRYVVIEGLHDHDGSTNTRRVTQILDLETGTLLAELLDEDADNAESDFDIEYYLLGFKNKGAVLELLARDGTNGSDPTTAELLFQEKRALLPTNGVLYMKDSNGKILNSDPNYLTSQLDIGTVYQTLTSDIVPITIVNGTNLTLVSIDLGSPDNVVFGTSEENFEGLETINLAEGYAPNDEITIYFKATTSIDSELGETSVSITLQGNE